MKLGLATRVWHPEKSVLLNCVIGDRCTIHAPVWIGNNVVIGDDCKVQAFAYLPDGVVLGNGVFVGPHVCFTNDKHPPSRDWQETIVEEWVSIGANCTILPGLRIGARSVVGAGSVVTRNVPPRSLVYGNPARVIMTWATQAA